MKRWIGVALTFLFLAGGFALWPGDEAMAQTGTISGTVKLAGAPPAAKKLTVTKDTAKCGQEKLSEELIVGKGGGLKNAVVNLVGITGKPMKLDKNPTLDQKTCQFIPHVLIVPAGGILDILNSDGILHNIHTYSTKNPTINKAQPGFKKKMTEKFAQPEIVKVTCDAHAWMNGWIVVADHPYYAVTDDAGSFKLTNVPTGTYKLRVWQESLGEQVKEITVKAGEEAKVTFELAKK